MAPAAWHSGQVLKQSSSVPDVSFKPNRGAGGIQQSGALEIQHDMFLPLGSRACGEGDKEGQSTSALASFMSP